MNSDIITKISCAELIFFGFKDDFLIKVLNYLNKSFSVFIFSWKHKNFYKTNQDYYDMFNLAKPYNLNKIIIEISKVEILKNKFLTSEFNECREYFDKMLNRVFIKKMSKEDSNLYFYNLLFFWHFIFSNNIKTKLITFDSTPHFPWDIVAFFVAKKFGIKILILKRTLISNRIVFSNDFREGYSNLIKNASNQKDKKKIINGRASSYWDKYSKDLIQSRIQNSKMDFIVLKKINQFLKNYFINIINLNRSYYNLNYLEYTYFVIAHLCKKLILRRLWKKNSIKKFNSSKKIIYFPLHFQPERSTDPEASKYSDQFHSIEILSKFIPDDWEIWVKEHPRQIPIEYPNIKRYHYRNKQDYLKLIKLKNVKLLNFDFSSEMGISKCEVVASCTGSILWEGLIKNKTAIRFGSTWHDDCKSCFYIDEVLKNKKFFSDQFNKKHTQIENNVNEFIDHLSDYSIFSSNSSLFVKKSNIEENILVNNFTSFIKSYINKN